MLPLAIFVGIIVVFLFFLYRLISLPNYDSLKNVPGPKPLPIIGNVFELGATPVELLKSFTKLENKYGTFFKLWFGSRLHVIMLKPEYIDKLLTSNVHLSKSTGYDLLRPWLGDGLLTTTGAKWKIRRKMITPTFHFKILEDFMTVFNKQFDIMQDVLRDKVEQSKGQSIDIHEIITLASLDIICETAFGIPIRAQFNENPKFVEANGGFMEIVMIRFFSILLRNPFLFWMSPYYKKYKKYLKTLKDLTTKVIKDRKAEWKDKQANSQRISDDGIKRKAALLDMMLEANINGESLSDEDIREEVDTFMFEGHDTTSSGMCFTLLALSEHQEVQQKVYNELVDVIGTDSKSEITISQINELKYLDMVVKEAMRFYPPVPMIERLLETDWTIDGITIPKGTNMLVFLYGMGHRPEVFPEPHKFDPERFLPEKQSSRHYYSYIPFSAGPRNCVGQKFALLELKTCIIKCLLNFELIPDLDFKPELGMAAVLRSSNGIKMKLRPRN